MPMGMDAVLSVDRHVGDVLIRGISPLIAASIFQSIRARGSGGGGCRRCLCKTLWREYVFAYGGCGFKWFRADLAFS